MNPPTPPTPPSPTRKKTSSPTSSPRWTCRKAARGRWAAFSPAWATDATRLFVLKHAIKQKQAYIPANISSPADFDAKLGSKHGGATGTSVTAPDANFFSSAAYVSSASLSALSVSHSSYFSSPIATSNSLFLLSICASASAASSCARSAVSSPSFAASPLTGDAAASCASCASCAG